MKICWLLLLVLFHIGTISCSAVESNESRPELIERTSRSIVHLLIQTKDGDVSSGTGFIVKEGGYILTCHHVIEDALKIRVHIYDGTTLTAHKDRNLKEPDLALLKAEGDLPPVLPLSKAKTRAGEEVLVIGFPDADLLGEDEPTVTKGMVSAVRFNGSLIQFDADVNPGNSGGPVINAAGEVIGVVRGSLKGRRGLNFATGIGEAASLLDKAGNPIEPTPATATEPESTGLLVAGRMAVVTQNESPIYSSPGEKPIYSIVPKDSFIVLVGQRDNYYAVLMADGRYGWIKKQKVILLNDISLNGKTGDPSLDFGNKAVSYALQYMGLPYKRGKYSTAGTDAPGFIKAVFAQCGVRLPRSAHDQARVGAEVSLTELQSGDRLYFSLKGKIIDHTGLYVGNGYFIHCMAANGRVSIALLTTQKYWSKLVAIRR